MIAVDAIGFDFAVELTYPMGESVSTGVCLCAGQIYGILITIAGGELIDNYDTKGTDISYTIIIAICFLGLLSSLYVK